MVDPSQTDVITPSESLLVGGETEQKRKARIGGSPGSFPGTFPGDTIEIKLEEKGESSSLGLLYSQGYYSRARAYFLRQWGESLLLLRRAVFIGEENLATIDRHLPQPWEVARSQLRGAAGGG
jgi:hypothetical protein